MRKILLLVALCCQLVAAAETKFSERPRLVVGIVVDQMRWDYLGRYYNQMGQGGFRRMIDQGYSMNNCLINYLPTVTAIGHTSAYTGSTPAIHGICGNNFFIDGRKTYCCTDETVDPVGTDNRKRGSMSPRNLLATTIGDQLRLHTDFRSKVVGVSYKDRAAMLPAGRSATSAYWLDIDNGQFITSTYYMTELPEWAKKVNKDLKVNKELKKVGKDVGLYPLCGHITTDMAIAALKGERLGQGEETDMLCVSYSQTDVIGHKWSTRGDNTDEAYLQLDRDLERLFNALDEQVGQGQWIAFLTADHGAAHNAQFMEDHKMNGGSWRWMEEMEQGLTERLQHEFKTSERLVAALMDYRIFLDKQKISEAGLDLQAVKRAVMDYLRQLPHMEFVIDYEQAAVAPVPPVLRDRALMGYHYRRSGDILFVLEPGFYEVGPWSSPVGTTHGEWNPYDAHIPLLFLGWKVPHGETSREVHITDIAPTICHKLHIQQPNGCVGEVISEVAN